MKPMKPDWSKAPEWANYWATLPNGACAWFETEPSSFDDGWTTKGTCSYDKRCPDWRDSLQERPAEVKPYVRIAWKIGGVSGHDDYWRPQLLRTIDLQDEVDRCNYRYGPGTHWIEEEGEEGWIPWNGGECPVPPGTQVDYRLRDGLDRLADCRMIGWDHYNARGDIISYRVHKEEPADPYAELKAAAKDPMKQIRLRLQSGDWAPWRDGAGPCSNWDFRYPPDHYQIRHKPIVKTAYRRRWENTSSCARGWVERDTEDNPALIAEIPQYKWLGPVESFTWKEPAE